MRNPTMLRCALLVLFILTTAVRAADDPLRLFPEGAKPADGRLSTVRTLDNKDFDLHTPATLQQWQKRRQEVREQILVANGLWPMPPKQPSKATIHGKIER